MPLHLPSSPSLLPFGRSFEHSASIYFSPSPPPATNGYRMGPLALTTRRSGLKPCQVATEENIAEDALPEDAPLGLPVIHKTATIHQGEALENIVPSITRRAFFSSSALCICLSSSSYFSAIAMRDITVSIEEVTPPVFSSGPLFPYERRIVELFEKNTYSVVNIFDITLRPQLNVTGVVEVPEGNGSGIVWDDDGHIVTNYHVVGNALSRNPLPDQVVARVNILASEGVQKNFEGKLVGVDRAKDLVVLKGLQSQEPVQPHTDPPPCFDHRSRPHAR